MPGRWCVPRAYKYVAFYDTHYSGTRGYEVLDGSGQITGYNTAAGTRNNSKLHV